MASIESSSFPAGITPPPPPVAHAAEEGLKPEKGDEPLHDGAAVSANLLDHFKNSPLLDRMSGLIASALVVSGVKTIYGGLKEGDREKFLSGSKQTLWGVYYGLNSIETVFKTAFSLTPGLRVIGGFVNADLGFTEMYRDYKKEGKLDSRKAMVHTSAVAWGLRHLALGLEGLSKTKWIATLINSVSPTVKTLVSSAPLMGAIGAGMGVAGGAIDAVLGARLLKKGIETGDREKKILGSMDIGIGVAMGVSCLLTGLPGMAAIGAGSLGIVYRTWRTDKDEINEYIKYMKDVASDTAQKVKKKVIEFFTCTPHSSSPPPCRGAGVVYPKAGS